MCSAMFGMLNWEEKIRSWGGIVLVLRENEHECVCLKSIIME